MNKYHIIKELKTQVNNFTAPSTFMASEAKKFWIPSPKKKAKGQSLGRRWLDDKKGHHPDPPIVQIMII